MNDQRLAIQNRAVDGALGFNIRVGVNQNFGAIGLTININQEDFFAFVGEAGGEGNRRTGFTHAPFLGCYRNHHRCYIARKPG